MSIVQIPKDFNKAAEFYFGIYFTDKSVRSLYHCLSVFDA